MLGLVELDAFTPDAAEVAIVRQRTCHPGPRLALLILLKTFQRPGHFVRLAEGPAAIIGHVAASCSLDAAIHETSGYADTTRRVRVSALVRGFARIGGRTPRLATRPRPRRQPGVETKRQ